MAQGNFVKERVNFLKKLDKSVLDEISDIDLRAMAGHLRVETHLGDHTILTQGTEVDRVIFIKSGFCKVVRQLHPRYKKAFDGFAEQGKPPPNPFADNEEEKQPRLVLPKCFHVDAQTADEALALDLGLGARPALRKFVSQYDDFEEATRKPGRVRKGGAQTARIPDGSVRTATSSVQSDLEAAAVGNPTDGGAGAENMVVLDVLQAGMSYGFMELIEGFTYQSSVVANPWAEVYVMSKYDLIRNTSKLILHKFFCDYKVRLTDERLVQRLKQKRRWNDYKRDLWDEICQRKTTNRTTID